MGSFAGFAHFLNSVQINVTEVRIRHCHELSRRSETWTLGVHMNHKPIMPTKVRFYLKVWMVFCAVLAFLPLLYAMYEAPIRGLAVKNPCTENFALRYNTIVGLGGVSWLGLAVLTAVILGGTYRRAIRFKSAPNGIHGRHVQLVITEACVFLLLCVANLAWQSKLLMANDHQERSCLNRYLPTHLSN